MSSAYAHPRSTALGVREPPIILWPFGETARALALRVVDDAPHRLRESGVVQLFEPGGEFRQPLMELIAGGAQRERFRASGVEVRLLISTWEVTAPIGEVLQEVSAILALAIPVNQSLTLALLIPPSVARSEDIEAARKTLQTVAAAMGKVRFFSSALLFPVLPDLYRARDGLPDGILPTPYPLVGEGRGGGPEPLSAADTLIDLADFLYRSALDPETVAIIDRLGAPLIQNGRQLDGEPAGFACLTARRVRYVPTECLRYLHARFQHEFFSLGLFAQDDLSRQQRESLRAQASDLIDQVRQTLLNRATSLGPWEPLIDLGEEVALEAASIREKLSEKRVQQAIATGEIRIRSGLTDLFKEIDMRMRGELDALLDRSPGFLAGAAFFLDLLRGPPAPGDADTEVGGLIGLESAFRQQPFTERAPALFKRWFTASLAYYESSPPGTSTDAETALEPIAQLLSLKADEHGPGVGSPGHFVVQAWRCVESAVASTEDGRRLLFDVCGGFLTESEAICRRLDSFDRAREELREQLKELRRTHPWYQFWRLVQYAKGKQQLQEQLDKIAQQREKVLTAYALTRTILHSLANELLWPHHARILMIDAVRQGYDKLRGTFDQYVDHLKATWAKEWGEARQIKVTDRWSEITVNSVERCDCLYQRILANPNWSRLVASALTFVPAGLELKGEEQPTYAAYSNLREHFNAAAGLLIDRVADFAEEMFKAARPLDILDIIELPDQTAARAFLTRVNSVMDAQPEFASGSIPRLRQQELFQRQRLIRCRPTIGERLRSDYSDLLGGNVVFKESDDPGQLDITTFTLGFPASVLHVLSNLAPATPARE